MLFDNGADPRDVAPHFGVDSREEGVCTADSPGHDTLEVAIADKGTARVALCTNRNKQRLEHVILVLNK